MNHTKSCFASLVKPPREALQQNDLNGCVDFDQIAVEKVLHMEIPYETISYTASWYEFLYANSAYFGAKGKFNLCGIFVHRSFILTQFISIFTFRNVELSACN